MFGVCTLAKEQKQKTESFVFLILQLTALTFVLNMFLLSILNEVV